MFGFSMANFVGKVAVSACAVVVAAPVSFIIKMALVESGVLDPIARVIAGWLTVTVTADFAGWSIALVVVAGMYLLICWLIWRHPTNIRSVTIHAGTPHNTEPTPKVIQVARDTPLRHAIAYAAFGDWNNRRFKEFRNGDAPRYATALDRFHQLASEGVLHVWGESTDIGATSVHRPIPKEFWHRAKLELPDAFGGNLVPKLSEPSFDSYADFQVSRAEFEREWPHAAE